MKYILIALLCIGLHSTNPSKTDFIEFASIQIKKKYPELDFKPESSATGLEKLISGFGNTMARVCSGMFCPASTKTSNLLSTPTRR